MQVYEWTLCTPDRILASRVLGVQTGVLVSYGLIVAKVITGLDTEKAEVFLMPLNQVSFNTMPTGQWSEPATSGIMNAVESTGNRAAVTKK